MDDIDVAMRSQAEVNPSGDLLAEAVTEGVLTAGDADLINRTRLEGERLGSVAQRLGLRYHTCRQRRARAEGRLAGYILVNGADSLAIEDRARLVERRCRQARTDTSRAHRPNDAA